MKRIEDIKKKNKKDILRLLYKKHNMSKKRIAIELGLSPSVITKLCAELKEEGLIILTTPLKTEKAGRKEIIVKINPTFKMCFGVTINHKYTTVLLTDMNLSILDQIKFPTASDSTKHLQQLIDSLKEIMFKFHLNASDFLGIGISLKGNTDGTYSNYGIWDNQVNIKDTVFESLHIPVAVDNGIRCSAMLELMLSTDENFIFIKYMEPGIGGAVIQDGLIKKGENHNILDFGHLIINPSGEYCPVCKRRGCLESIISYEQIIHEAKSSFSEKNLSILWNLCDGNPEAITIHKIIDAVEAGCIGLNELFKRNAQLFAMCVINTYSLLDINKIIIMSELFSSDRFQSYFKAAILDYQLTPIYEHIKYHIHENVMLAAPVLALHTFLF